MRVIAGENKGRTLHTIASQRTRPTTDKVKETLFNMIGPYFDGGAVLDLYAGSGGLAIEALSRGAAKAVLVDKAAAACRVIRQNLVNCRYQKQTSLLQTDAKRALELLAERGEQFDYIFLDPPYAQQQLVRDIDFLISHALLRRNALIIAEHEDKAILPETFAGNWRVWKYRTYQGKTALSIYRQERLETTEGLQNE
ncbi:MAG: 16S rRNA (guanine(966)-N(2))-methyltransferase RsmD [Sporolactobacillus sp.]